MTSNKGVKEFLIEEIAGDDSDEGDEDDMEFDGDIDVHELDSQIEKSKIRISCQRIWLISSTILQVLRRQRKTTP